MSDVIARLRALQAAASRADEWDITHRGGMGYDVDALPAEWPQGLRGTYDRREDAEYVCAALNAVPLLLDVCEAARAYRAEWNGPNGTAAWNHLMTTLARLEDE